MKYLKISGVFILIVSCFIVYERRDIFIEILNGRSLDEIEISDLILPLCLLILGVFLILKKSNNASQKESD